MSDMRDHDRAAKRLSPDLGARYERATAEWVEWRDDTDRLALLMAKCIFQLQLTVLVLVVAVVAIGGALLL